MSKTDIPRALTIAGSDSGGGAGIQADLKTFTCLGVYGMSAITALTAQNTQTVAGVSPVKPDFVTAQIDAVCEDIGVDAAKTGMLFDAPIIEAVASAVSRHKIDRLVVDPVMIAKSGDALLKPVAQSALKDLLLPRAYLVTPNVPEAEVLSGVKIESEAQLDEAANAILEAGPKYVLMKGGHLEGEEAVDILIGKDLRREFRSMRVNTKNTHGTGCTFSAAITAYLACDLEIVDAIAEAKIYLQRAIEQSMELGKGHGPLNHMAAGSVLR